MSPPTLNGRRTNSLAFAKTDCHTCIATQIQCDRQRPRCSACSAKKIVCGGYPMQLTWSKSKPQHSGAVLPSEYTDDPFYIEPLSRQASVHLMGNVSLIQSRKRQKYTFVAEHTPDQKQISTECNGACSEQSGAHVVEAKSPSPAFIQQSNDIAAATIIHPYMLGCPPLEILDNGVEPASSALEHEYRHNSEPCPNIFHISIYSDPTAPWKWSSLEPIAIDSAGGLGNSDKEYSLVEPSTIIEDDAARNQRTPASRPEDSWQIVTPLRAPVLHESLFDKFAALLNMYDQDFCVMPLSGDVASNPFRCRSETFRGSRPLLHAVIAVSSYHAGRISTTGDYPPFFDHQNTAVRLYRDALDTCIESTSGLQLLDTAMVIFLLNATHAAFNNWATQISDAWKLLRLSGGPESWVDNRRIQAQVVMILWWDATIALVSRQGPILPYSYFQALLTLEDDNHWSFFSLIGCPRQLVVPLMQLARLAEENEKAASMHCARFDPTLVDEIQASIINWENPSFEFEDDLPEEKIQQQRDEWNCVEAWRYGLLIYIIRVFQWDRTRSPPSRLIGYARHVFEHVYSCRKTAVVQKQLLLPLFFGGCETKDQYFRRSIRDYCRYWDKASGYNLFRTASSLLEDIWQELDRSPYDDVWWGSVVDKKQDLYQFPLYPMQFCFG
ncbi:fungal-specific transcription factor domain-containing protein [Truncatella angustata]|uniref:Fungal-specific transcription factor domain-containing protein n=1 Tax=Truncatella angustata TaxID=152316 RepID=A0A9P8RI09_9PEZI|nr:fungal-specific transcription factor domain-containing protein [Truncatella angustata]KAH6646199.1 fungal-specific transcription factor domain-containing protein [Truncatella angustata]